MEITKQELQAMLDTTRVRAKNELQILLNQLRDKMMFHMDNHKQIDRQLLKQAIAIAEHAVSQANVLESRTSTLEQELKALQVTTQRLAEQQNVSVPVSAFAVSSENPRRTWRFSNA